MNKISRKSGAAAPKPAPPALPAPAHILHAMAEGVYLTDPDRRIVFWNRAAERITGWTAPEVLGKTCADNILIHIDKDGHPLCGEEFCPLHRAIVTGRPGEEPLLVYAQTKSGRRMPVEVFVAPIHDDRGAVAGGLEVFRDLSAAEEDLRCARLIQRRALAGAPPEDYRFQFGLHHVPHELIGADFYRLEALGPDEYVGMVADVMGHGVAAALYTMQLRALWEEFRPLLSQPALFFEKLNAGLHRLAHADDYFATAFFFRLDAGTGRMRYVNAGHPDPILLRRNGAAVFVSEHGPGLGLFAPAAFPEAEVVLEPGDTLIAYTNGVVEIFNDTGEDLQESGLAAALIQSGAGAAGCDFARVEEILLKTSRCIRFPDDLTILRVRRAD